VSHVSPGQDAQKYDIPQVSPSEWRIDFIDQSSSGTHKISILLNAKQKNGNPIDLTLPTINYEMSKGIISKDESPKDKQSSTTEQNKLASDDNKSAITPINWFMVSLRVLMFNVLLIIFIVAGYKLWQPVSNKLFALPKGA
jgi:hypothetical protein